MRPQLLARSFRIGIVETETGYWVYGPTDLVVPTRQERREAVKALLTRCPANCSVRTERVDEYVRPDALDV